MAVDRPARAVARGAKCDSARGIGDCAPRTGHSTIAADRVADRSRQFVSRSRYRDATGRDGSRGALHSGWNVFGEIAGVDLDLARTRRAGRSSHRCAKKRRLGSARLGGVRGHRGDRTGPGRGPVRHCVLNRGSRVEGRGSRVEGRVPPTATYLRSATTLTFTCAVTSRWILTGTVVSPSAFSGSASVILRLSMSKPLSFKACAMSCEVTEP